jgi:hypothetical protein
LPQERRGTVASIGFLTGIDGRDDIGLTDVTVLIGYFTSVSMTLAAPRVLY